MHQQHGRRLRPVATSQNKPVDVETGMRAACGAKQHIKPAVQQFGQVCGELQHHHVVADRRLTQLARRSSGRFQEARRNSKAELPAAQRRRSLFRRPGNEVDADEIAGR